jgi:hypothetical protein
VLMKDEAVGFSCGTGATLKIAHTKSTLCLEVQLVLIVPPQRRGKG